MTFLTYQNAAIYDISPYQNAAIYDLSPYQNDAIYDLSPYQNAAISDISPYQNAAISDISPYQNAVISDISPYQNAPICIHISLKNEKLKTVQELSPCCLCCRLTLYVTQEQLYVVRLSVTMTVQP